MQGRLVAVERGLRDLIGTLRPAVLAEHVARLRREDGAPPIALALDPAGRELAPPVARTLWRVAQEALRNALRHAGATRIAVRLLVASRWAELVVADDGRGADVPTPLSSLARAGHFGLVGLEEEVTLAGGRLTMATPPAIRVLLADNHPLVRAGLRLTLADEPDIAVVGEAVDGSAARGRCAEVRPDVLLLDLQMPGPPAAETVAHLRARWPTIRVVMVTAFDDARQLRELVRLGVVGYVLKDEPPAAVVAAVRAAHGGGTWFSPAIAARLAVGEPVELTPRDRELLRLLAAGCTTRESAERVHLGDQTTRNYLSQLYAKLGVPNHTAAATWAREHGLG